MKQILICTALVIIGVTFLYQCKKDSDDIPADPMHITAEISHVSSYGGCNGSIDISVSGGNPPYAYNWSNQKINEDIDSLYAGTYMVTVTDSKAEISIDTFLVNQPNPESLHLSIARKNVSWYGGDDGAAYANVTGGIKPYEYHWSNGCKTKDNEGLEAGIYYLTVSDLELNSVMDSIYIFQPDPDELIILFTLTHPSETGTTDGAIQTEILGGEAPYTIQWSTGADSANLANIASGVYIIQVTDSKEHTLTDTAVLKDYVEDIDGNTYNYIKIGVQTWMQENLKVTHTPDGGPVTSYAYNDEMDSVAVYGRLYTWTDAMNGSTVEKAQGICPCGWHIPSDFEFKELEMFLGMTQEEANMINTWRGTDVGTKLKTGGTSGYNARLCGRRSSSGSYSLLGMYEYVWTSSEYGDNAWRRCLDIYSNLVGRWNTFPKTYGFSVRCIKDHP